MSTISLHDNAKNQGAATENLLSIQISQASFATLLTKLHHLTPIEIDNVRQAYRMADEAHLGQMRKNGDPYITHPIAVAVQCTHWKLDAPALMAALLHDVIEDCGVTHADLVERFGVVVANLVDGLTKLDHLDLTSRKENQAASFRKMLLAVAQDIRVILIKLADRTHNMRTMGDMHRSKWQRIAQETLEIYVPIAQRLGLNETYKELQELSFQYAMPWRFAVVTKAVEKVQQRRSNVVEEVKAHAIAAFAKYGLVVEVAGREKSLYAIYQKMSKRHVNFSDITDIYAFRIMVPDVLACYTALGVLHGMYKPMLHKFKDYIANPKQNGYQSLHTTLMGPAGLHVEFQIRTSSMQKVAQAGVAAHWLYKGAQSSDKTTSEMSNDWLQSLFEIQNDNTDAVDLLEHIKVDLFPKSVYVRTPKNKVIALPKGGTVLDFAYAIHSSVGGKAANAKVNGIAVPLFQVLASGDVVDVGTHADVQPHPSWLEFVQTAKARSSIRCFLKTTAHSQATALGATLLRHALHREGIPGDDIQVMALEFKSKILHFSGNPDWDSLQSDVALGKRNLALIAKKWVQLWQDAGRMVDLQVQRRERLLYPHVTHSIEVEIESAHVDINVNVNISNATVENYQQHRHIQHEHLFLTGKENRAIAYGTCCHPIPQDSIVGYLKHNEGLTIHHEKCGAVQRLLRHDAERFIAVDWSDDVCRTFDVVIVVTAHNGVGVLASLATCIAKEMADIAHVEIPKHQSGDTSRLAFTLKVRDTGHLQDVLHALQRLPHVVQAQRDLFLSLLPFSTEKNTKP